MCTRCAPLIIMEQIKKDCFAYSKNSECGCSALKRLYCKEEHCKFYKTERNGKYPASEINVTTESFPVSVAKN